MKTPFKFLDPYELKDFESYFGREEETKQLYSMVTRNRINFVYGPSGTGKTSLIQCGLASRFGTVDWLPLWIRRGNDINTSLRSALTNFLKTAGLPYQQKDSNAALIKQLFNRYLRPVYLIFDQFEELFILGDADDNKERLPFYNAIEEIIEADLPCRIIFAMREDYFGYLNHFEKIIPELYYRKLRVEPMNRSNLLRVISGTCNSFGISFDDPVKAPETILDYISGDKSSTFMPYVQVYLHMLYQEAYKAQYGDQAQTEPARSVVFTNKIIREVGPISDVLGRFLKEQEAEISKSLSRQYPGVPEDLVRMVMDVFVTDEGTKAPITYHTKGDNFILEGKSTQQLASHQAAWVTSVLKDLEKSKILRQTDETFEVAHDSLALLIDQQRSVEQRQLNELRLRLDTAYREHLDSKGAYYLNSGQLARIEPFKSKLGLDNKLLEFIKKSEVEVQSIAEKEKEKEREKLRLTEEKLAAEELSRKRQTFFSYIIGAVAMVAIVAGVYGFYQKNKADTARDEAIDKRNEADSLRDIAEVKEKEAKTLLEEIAKQRGITDESLKKTAEAIAEVQNKELARQSEESARIAAEKQNKIETDARLKAEQQRKNEAAKNINTKIDEINTLLSIGDLDGAKEKLRKALEIAPDNAKLLKLKKDLKLN